MIRRSLAALALSLIGAVPSPADDVVPSVRLGTVQGPSVAVSLVAGGPFLCFYGCGDDSSGLVLDFEGGLTGLKGAVGVGLGDRGENGKDLLALKAAVLRTWERPLVGPGQTTYAGPELDVVATRGVSLAALKRVDGPGWRLSLSLVQAF
jgi:hypothetical protein